MAPASFRSLFSLLVFNVALTGFSLTPALALANPAAICDQVAQTVAKKSGVPITVLQAITRTETGRKKDGRFGPWPWTVNMEGKGVWFDTLDDARAYVFKNFKRGARSFDVGCFQINYKWHHEAFSSIDEMFDPMANATYAAKFLNSLFQEYGNWSDAAGAYHSRTPKYANRYKAIFEKHRARSPGESAIPVRIASTLQNASPKPRINSFPLLQSDGRTVQLGSLVPLGHQTAGSSFLNIGSRPEG